MGDAFAVTSVPGLPAVLGGLRAAGVRVFVVGGALRDARLGRPVRDVDLLVPGPVDALPGLLEDAHAIGGQRPLVLLPARPDRLQIEITGLRPNAADLETDLRLRDFTINALAFDPVDGRWIDPTGGGADLEAGRIRAIAPDRCFRDDPVRTLRALRFADELDFALEPGTRAALGRDVHRLALASAERLRDELVRVLERPRAAPLLGRLREHGALATLLPELLRGIGVAQNRHHPDDVYIHTLRVIDLCRPDPWLRLAAALHDVAKADTKCWQAQREDFSFHRHDARARRHVLAVALRLRLSNAVRDRVLRLVRHHLLYPERLETPKSLRRMLSRVGRDILDDLLELRRADYRSRQASAEGAPEASLAAWLAAEERIRDAARDPEPPLRISGADVMRELRIPAGPEVGVWLARARRRALDTPGPSREELLAWLRRGKGSR